MRSTRAQVKLSIQGGSFSLGDRVVSVLAAGVPGFGLRGTVIGAWLLPIP